MTSLRVAAGQATSVAGDVAANVATAVDLVEQAVAAAVRLLVLPEAFLVGYDEQVFAGSLPTPGELPDLLAPLVSAASRGGVVVVVGVALDRGDRRTLSSVVVDASGALSVPYDKQHLSGYEQHHFVPGDHGASIVVDGIELGLGICYDCSFPEHARRAASDGAVGYLVSAAFFPGGAERLRLYAAARALDNGMYVVFSGITGACGAERFIGGSAVHDPEGRVLAVLADEPGLAVADLEVAVVEATRSAHPMLAERRSDLGGRTRVELGWSDLG